MRFVFAQVFGFHNDNRKPMGTLVGQETQNKKSSKTTHVKSHDLLLQEVSHTGILGCQLHSCIPKGKNKQNKKNTA